MGPALLNGSVYGQGVDQPVAERAGVQGEVSQQALEVTDVGPKADPAHVLQQHIQGVPCPACHMQRCLSIPLQRPSVLLLQHHIATVTDAVGRSTQRGWVQKVPGQLCAVQYKAVGLLYGLKGEGELTLDGPRGAQDIQDIQEVGILPQGHLAVGVLGGGRWHWTRWQGLELADDCADGKQLLSGVSCL